MNPQYSLIICTYNRHKVLAICLESIARLVAPADVQFEVLLIDNNSQDATPQTFSDIRKGLPEDQSENWSYFLEKKQGLSHARNRGFDESSGKWLVFLDDECELEPDWIARLHREIEKHAPLMIGGPYRGKFLPNINLSDYAPDFLERYGDSYHLRDHWPGRWLLKPGLSGGNMAVRRDTLEKAGLFDPDLGMSGSKISYGEETELQIRILENKPDHSIYYSPELALVHYIRPEKTGVRQALVGCIQRAKNVANLKYAQISAEGKVRNALLPQSWILIRRFLALAFYFGSSFLRACFKRDFMSRPIYDAIYSGKLQALLQVALTIGLCLSARQS